MSDILRQLQANLSSRHGAARSGRFCLLLGAEAEIALGGVTYASVVRRFVQHRSRLGDSATEELAREVDTFERIESSDLLRREFASFLQRLDLPQPSDAYKLIALLTDAKVINAVVTTNVDDMLESAAECFGKNIFRVFGPGVAKPFPYRPGDPGRFGSIYLKLCGDVRAGVVTHLSRKDKATVDYDVEIAEFLSSILMSHLLLIVGETGFDAALARIAATSISSSMRVCWVNAGPLSSDSPLFQALRSAGVEITFEEARFDSFVQKIARPTLEMEVFVQPRSSFVAPILSWRIAYQNNRFLASYAFSSSTDRRALLIERRAPQQQVDQFRMSRKPLGIISGPSGYGKTTLVVRLHDTWASDPNWKVILLAARSIPTGGQLADHLAGVIGIANGNGVATLLDLAKWCGARGDCLLIVVDGLNEHDPAIINCIRLLKQIVQLCMFLGDESPLRFLITVRTEAWREILSQMDRGTLDSVLWSGVDENRSMRTIPMTRFGIDELREAYRLYSAHFSVITPFHRIAVGTLERLADPYLLSLACQNSPRITFATPTAKIYRIAFEHQVRSSCGADRAAAINDALSDLALLGLARRQDYWRRKDLVDCKLRDDEVRVLVDVNILAEADLGLYRFHHDRVFEYFLSLGFSLRLDPTIRTLTDVRDILLQARHYPRLAAALRMHFLFNEEKFVLLHEILLLQDTLDPRFSERERDEMFVFGKEVLLELCEANPELIAGHATGILDAARSADTAPACLRSFVQAAAQLESQFALPVLSTAVRAANRVVRLEAHTYLIDHFARYMLRGEFGAPSGAPDAHYLLAASLPTWERIARLLGVVSRIGPDNANPSELRDATAILRASFHAAIDGPLFRGNELEEFINVLFENRDKYLFNATYASVADFYRNEERFVFLPILERLARREPLSLSDVQRIRRFVDNHEHNFEFQIANILCVLSMRNNPPATAALFDLWFGMFHQERVPEEVDFVLGAVLYAHVANDLDPSTALSRYTETLLTDFEDVFLYSPGLARGAERGFVDAFDQVFEDGYNPLASYCFCVPSAARRAARHSDYAQQRFDPEESAPILMAFMRSCVTADRTDVLLRIIHAIGQMVSLWPSEGLSCLAPVMGVDSPIVRRAVARVVAEAYARYPMDTLLFLSQSGHEFSNEDVIQIKYKIDSRLSVRQFETLEWSRIFHFMIDLVGDVSAIAERLARFITAKDLVTGITAVLS